MPVGSSGTRRCCPASQRRETGQSLAVRAASSDCRAAGSCPAPGTHRTRAGLFKVRTYRANSRVGLRRARQGLGAASPSRKRLTIRAWLRRSGSERSMSRPRLLAVGLVGLLSSACSHPPASQGAQPATFALASSPAPTASALPLVVSERSCTGGRTAEGRIVASARYLSDRVAVRVLVRPLISSRGHEYTCQGAPETHFSFALAEPVGHRKIVDASSDALLRVCSDLNSC